MRRAMMLLGAVLALAGCSAAMEAPGGTLPTAFVGSWEGRGTQSDAPDVWWTISANIIGGMPGGIIGTIAYPSLECTGELRLRAVEPTRMELAEHITSGRCVDGIITLTPTPAGGLRYDWRMEGGDLTARGTLSRAGQ
jgi:hypothetical protein